MRARAVAIGILVSSACAAREIDLPFPPLQDAQSMLLAVERRSDRAVLELGAFELADPDQVHRLRGDLPEGLLAEAVLYPRPLAAIGLAEGAVPGTDPTEASRPIPAEDRVFTATLGAGKAEEWTASARSSALDAFRIAARPCTRFVTTSREITGVPDDPSFAVALDPETVLLGNTVGRVFRIRRDTIEELAVAQGSLLFAGVVDRAGQLWVGGAGGRIYRAAIVEQVLMLTPAFTSSSGEGLRMIDGDGEEMFSLSLRGTFERHTGGRSEILHRFLITTLNGGSGGALIRLGPGSAIATTEASGPDLARYSAGRVTIEQIAEPGVSVLAGRDIEGLGPALAEIGGSLFVHQGRGWVRLSGPAPVARARVIEPFEDGFIEAGRYGFISQYRVASNTSCPLSESAPSDVRSSAPFGRGVALFTRAPTGGPSSGVTILEPGE